MLEGNVHFRNVWGCAHTCWYSILMGAYVQRWYAQHKSSEFRCARNAADKKWKFYKTSNVPSGTSESADILCLCVCVCTWTCTHTFPFAHDHDCVMAHSPLRLVFNPLFCVFTNFLKMFCAPSFLNILQLPYMRKTFRKQVSSCSSARTDHVKKKNSLCGNIFRHFPVVLNTAAHTFSYTQITQQAFI